MVEILSFQRVPDTVALSDLTKIPIRAYERFLQRDVPSHKRKNMGLESLFREIFPIKNYDGSVSMEYQGFVLGQPRYSPDECRQLRLTYGSPLKVLLRLNRAEPVEEEVYLGEIPLMLGGGEFIINGAERVIVSQLHRSPGVDFREEKQGDRKFQSAWIVPERGSWIELAVTRRDALAMKIDQGGRIPFTTFLRAVSPDYSTNADIIRIFYTVKTVRLTENTPADALKGRVLAQDVRDPEKKELVVEAGAEIQEATAKFLLKSGMKEVQLIEKVDDPLVLNTLREDPTHSHEEALQRIYAKLRPGTPHQLERARTLLHERFFDPNRYRLGRVGRFRLNRKFGLPIEADGEQTLQKEDLIHTVRYLMKMRRGEGFADDIDDLGNRRVRTIDELASEEIRKGFLRLRRTIGERLNLETQELLTPRALINSKTVSSAIEYFFGRSELSQVVDQTNPLAQLTHERRLSALGPGGLNRKRAGFEVRDVHMSHYGRICPIETPEGTNIGLISSLSLYTDIDEYGFLTAPYFRVKDGKRTQEVVSLRANEEAEQVMAPADSPVKDAKLQGERVLSRHKGEISYHPCAGVSHIDVSPKQIIGVSASLIPFLEHNDANRALMGSNMQRQAVPLLISEPPMIFTGMEKVVAENSSMVVTARRDGIVQHADAQKIVVETSDGEEDVYPLKKFFGLNERTCLNQKPIVRPGQRVHRAQVIADGPATCQGELSLGRNVLVAFMPWEGYNFEDAIIVSERLLRDDVFSSIHIEEFEIEIRETKLGREEFTRDIPNVSEKALRNLGEDGIVRIGTRIRPGDILVGKVAPKSKSELTPEEKLLHAIFGRAGEDVKNDSLEVPAGMEGIVIDTRRFSRRLLQSEKERESAKRESRKIEREYEEQVQKRLDKFLKEFVLRFGADTGIRRSLSFGAREDVNDLRELRNQLGLGNLQFKGKREENEAAAMIGRFFTGLDELESEKDRKVGRVLRGDELPTGVLEMVKVYMAAKRNLSVGDKMAGRHGNKGVLAKILRDEDMPFLEDGTPVDILLNPLGVPSRMNVGQILETHLGWAAHKLGYRVLTPVFEGCSEDDVFEQLKRAGLPPDGKAMLFDGRTGEPFYDKVTVGYIYTLKLAHLVDDKVHARATGPYSLITQQPLGGKARYGGQRFGEMEVWALEAYGAANILQELLTVKSDDVDGRTKIYESMVKGENTVEPGTPMSFEVLTNEIKGLCLNLKLEKRKIF